MKHLTAKDIADELDIGLTAAYDVVKQCRHLVIGRSLRVSRPCFEAWKRRHEVEPVAPPAGRKPARLRTDAELPELARRFRLAQGVSIEPPTDLDIPPKMRRRKPRLPE